MSFSTKRDIVRHYPSSSKKISVTHHGYDKKRFNSSVSLNDVRRTKKKYHIVSDYVLFLSTLKPSKNIEGILEAFSLLTTRHPKLALVIAGKKGWLYRSVFEKTKELGVEKSVIFTDFVPENDKAALLTGAKVFVSPSFWEGFGMHVLEAMACGTPVVVSKIASLPEVAGKAGMYVDSKDPKDIARGVVSVLKLKGSAYNRLVKTTLSQANKFSWEKTADDTLRILRRAAELD